MTRLLTPDPAKAPPPRPHRYTGIATADVDDTSCVRGVDTLADGPSIPDRVAARYHGDSSARAIDGLHAPALPDVKGSALSLVRSTTCKHTQLDTAASPYASATAARDGPRHSASDDDTEPFDRTPAPTRSASASDAVMAPRSGTDTSTLWLSCTPSIHIASSRTRSSRLGRDGSSSASSALRYRGSTASPPRQTWTTAP